MAVPSDAIKLHEYLAALHADAAVIDLRAPPPTPPPTGAGSDSDGGGGGGTSRPGRGIKRERATFADDDNESTGSARREHHNKHTRKCRARLKSKFDALLATLPPPPGAREVKHKVQVLDYAMDAFRALDDELRALEWQLALRSQAHLLRWVASSARSAPDLAAAAQPFIELLCARMGFVYAECWRPAPPDAGAGAGVGAVAGVGDCFVERFHFQPHPWCGAATVERLAAAGERAVRAQHVVDATLPPLALALQGMKPVACAATDVRPDLAVPTALLVPIPVMGEIQRVVAFFDVRERPIGNDTEQLATVVASAVGNVFCAAEHERAVQEKLQVGSRGAGAGRPKT